jgi:hypothetical protein
MRLRKDFGDMAKLYSSATRMPDEVLHDTGFDIPCFAVRVTNAPIAKGSKRLKNP